MYHEILYLACYVVARCILPVWCEKNPLIQQVKIVRVITYLYTRCRCFTAFFVVLLNYL